MRPYLLVLFLALPLHASELAITGGGARAVDIDPASAADNCSGVTYSPSVAGDAMYVVHDRLVNHCKFDLMSPDRFGDRIARSARLGGAWEAPQVVMDRGSLPWMQDEAYLRAHPDAMVGHLASPSVLKIGERWVMAFTASVNDPNLCAGEHPAGGTPCGSCRDPWSYFVAMWAVSDDGIHWRVRAPESGRANRALDAALLWRTPTAAEAAAPSQFKGLTRVSIIDHEESDRKWIYFISQFWNRQFIKSLLFRMPWDEASEWGITGEPQMLTSRGWEAIEGGRIPVSIDDSTSPFSLFLNFGNIARQTMLPGGRYIALGPTNSYEGYIVRPQSVIAWSQSTDLIAWKFGGFVRSTIPYVADGTGYSVSVIDPTYYEDVGGAHLLVASADGDEAAGIARDGKHDCATAFDGSMPTAPYVGTGVYDYELGQRELIPTSTTLEAPQSAAAGGALRVRVTVRAANGEVPHGVVTVYGGGQITELLLVDGQAEADVVMPGRTTEVTAAFRPTGLYLFSSAHQVVQAVPTARRRAGGR